MTLSNIHSPLPPPSHGGHLQWAATIAGCGTDRILDFSASINPLGPPDSAIAAIQDHLLAIRHYPDPDYGQLRSALSQRHGLPIDWILPGNGAAELLTWACWDLSQQAATYLLTPAFGDYGRALKSYQAKVVPCPLPLSSPEAFTLSLPDCQTSSGLLLNNPHNPTGQAWLKSEILPHLDQFALVVVDEAFMDFLPEERQFSLIEAVRDYPNLVILRSLTKFYSLAGLRLGYAIAHPDRLRQWQQRRDPWSVNILAAAAGTAVLQDRAFQHQTFTWLPPARSQLEQAIAQLPGLCPYPSAANFLLVECQTSVPQLQRQLLQQHQILIRDGLSFPELGEAYFRVAVRLEAENQRLIEGLREILS